MNIYRQNFLPCLGRELEFQCDNPYLWETAINTIYHDAHYLIENSTHKKIITTTIGICSHWLRPNQTRWKAGGGFAWPSGYNGPAYSHHGLPEYDWYYIWVWNSETKQWSITSVDDLQPLISKKKSKRVNFEVILPARTDWHQQSVVYTRWSPGSPVLPKEELRQFFGFRRKDWKIWTLEATLDYPHVDRHYEKARANEPKVKRKLDDSEIEFWQSEYEKALFM